MPTPSLTANATIIPHPLTIVHTQTVTHLCHRRLCDSSTESLSSGAQLCQRDSVRDGNICASDVKYNVPLLKYWTVVVVLGEEDCCRRLRSSDNKRISATPCGIDHRRLLTLVVWKLTTRGTIPHIMYIGETLGIWRISQHDRVLIPQGQDSHAYTF